MALALRNHAAFAGSTAASRTRQASRSSTHMGRMVMPAPVHPRARPAARAPRARAVTAVTVEANLFSRLFRVFRSYATSFTEQFEDPEVLLDRVVEEMGEDLMKMRQTTARVMGSEKQMTAKYNTTQATADEWLRRAELAVRKGDDELAREALARRKSFESAAAALKVQLDAQRKAREQLSGNMRMLEAKMNEARNKRETLKARAASAKSSKAIQEMVAGLRLNTSTAWGAFDKMEEKVLAMEAEADSAAALVAPDSVESRFAALETGTVEDELEALKSGMLRAPAALPAAASSGSSRSSSGAGKGSWGSGVREEARPLVGEFLVMSSTSGGTGVGSGAGTGGRRARALELDAVEVELEELRRRARG